jgi:acyl dehydratase
MCALTMRLICDGFLNRTLSRGSPGVDEVRWRQPMRPDSDLMLDATVLDCRVSKSRPELGIVRFRFELRDQAKAVLMTMESPIMIGRRDPGHAEAQS